MKLEGKNIDDAEKAWFQDEFKQGSLRVYDLGKFFSGVSIGTMGFFLSLYRLFEVDYSTKVTAGALAAFVMSLIVSIWMVIPRLRPLSSTTDLSKEYQKDVRKGLVGILMWALGWVLGTGLATIAVLPQEITHNVSP